MERYLMRKEYGQVHLGVPLRGARLLTHPLFNKGTAFSRSERSAFALEGLLPDAVSTMEQQARRAYANIVRKEDLFERYIGLAALQDRNEHLFHRVLADHLDELLPIVYAPTVGRACQEFSRIFRRARGLWITPAHQGRIGAVLANAPGPEVRLVIVTDNERVLGLGDQGAGGMALPVGKAALYAAVAGIHPSHILPISLDVGTDNTSLLDDDLYLGWRWPRLRGPEYDGFVEEFVHALHRRFPHALLQWEDLKSAGAIRLLDRYQRLVPSFNDDVQGTGVLVLSALTTAARITGRPVTAQRVVIAGAGAAGLGIARTLRENLAQAGHTHEEAVRAVAVVDHHGLVVEGSYGLAAHKRDLAWPAALAEHHGLREGARSVADVVRQLRPTVLVGTTGRRGLFTEEVVKAVGSPVERPIVLALSIPEARAEAQPEDVLAWSEGRALVATGGAARTLAHAGVTTVASQASTVLVFPGLALGALVSKAYEVTTGMLRAAAAEVSESVTAAELAEGRLLPPLSRLREITPRVAEAVVRAARESGVGLPLEDSAIPRAVADARWDPSYPVFDPLPEPAAVAQPVGTGDEQP